MSRQVVIRAIRSDELDWVNQKYDEVDFVHSAPDSAHIAIAEVDGTRAGVGRLNLIDPSNCELSGIYVFPAFRGLGLATRLTAHLINLARPASRIFCLPFAHLEVLYQQSGFETVDPPDDLPEALRDKLSWTNKRYEGGVLLMQHIDR